MAQGYTQIEGIDLRKPYTVARLEAMQMTLAFASYKDFKLFQMDVKSTFLNGFIDEKVYVEQPPGFVDPTHLNFFSKLDYKREKTLKLRSSLWLRLGSLRSGRK